MVNRTIKEKHEKLLLVLMTLFMKCYAAGVVSIYGKRHSVGTILASFGLNGLCGIAVMHRHSLRFLEVN